MKPFLISLGVLAAIAIGWNYWAMRHAASAPRPGIAGGFQSDRPIRGGRGSFGPTTSVSGFVRMAGGVTHSAHVDLVRLGPNGPGRVYASDEVLGDGKFIFPSVSADRYWVVAQSDIDADPMRPGLGPTQRFVGTAEVVSDGEHPGRVGVQLFPSSSLSGRVTVTPFTEAAAKSYGAMSVTLVPADAQTRAAFQINDGPAGVGEDGRFSIPDVPQGRYTLDVGGALWTLDSVVVADHDRLDQPFQIGSGERLAASIRLTAHANEIAGTLRDEANRARAFTLVAAFTVDAGRRDGHRRVQLVRTDAKGVFEFRGLPSGDYFLAPASGFDPPAWLTPEFFSRLTPIATRVSVGGGFRKTQDLRTADAR